MSVGKEWRESDIIEHIRNQLRSWLQNTDNIAKPFITISREFGSNGWALAQKIAEKLNSENKYQPAWVCYNKKILTYINEDPELFSQIVESFEEPVKKKFMDFFEFFFADKPSRTIAFKKTAELIKALACHGHVIIVGRGGGFISREMEAGFHLRIVAPLYWRVNQIAQHHQKLPREDIEQYVKQTDRARNNFLQEFCVFEECDPNFYDLVINTCRFTLDDAANTVIYAMKKKGILK